MHYIKIYEDYLTRHRESVANKKKLVYEDLDILLQKLESNKQKKLDGIIKRS